MPSIDTRGMESFSGDEAIEVAKERSDGGGDELSSLASRKGEAAFHKISMRALASRCRVRGFFAPDGSAAAWRQNLSGVAPMG
jgi:hypothetical protein